MLAGLFSGNPVPSGEAVSFSTEWADTGHWAAAITRDFDADGLPRCRKAALMKVFRCGPLREVSARD